MGTASGILDQAVRRLNELSTSSPVRWVRDELLVFFNDGMAELNLIAADYQQTHEVAIDGSENIIDLPDSVIGVFSVRTNEYGYLTRQFVEDLDKEIQWEASGVTSSKIKYWASVGLKKIIIAPRPVSSTTLFVEALTQYDPVPDAPFDMSGWIRPEYESCIEDFIVSRAMFKEGGAEASQALLLYTRFLDTVQQLSGRNIIRRYPSWDVAPEAKASETVLGRRSDQEVA